MGKQQQQLIAIINTWLIFFSLRVISSGHWKLVFKSAVQPLYSDTVPFSSEQESQLWFVVVYTLYNPGSFLGPNLDRFLSALVPLSALRRTQINNPQCTHDLQLHLQFLL